jgi:hypothetical protein
MNGRGVAGAEWRWFCPIILLRKPLLLPCLQCVGEGRSGGILLTVWRRGRWSWRPRRIESTVSNSGRAAGSRGSFGAKGG